MVYEGLSVIMRWTDGNKASCQGPDRYQRDPDAYCSLLEALPPMDRRSLRGRPVCRPAVVLTSAPAPQPKKEQKTRCRSCCPLLFGC